MLPLAEASIRARLITHGKQAPTHHITRVYPTLTLTLTLPLPLPLTLTLTLTLPLPLPLPLTLTLTLTRWTAGTQTAG